MEIIKQTGKNHLVLHKQDKDIQKCTSVQYLELELGGHI